MHEHTDTSSSESYIRVRMYTISTHVLNGISLIRTFYLSDQNIMAFDRGGSDNQGFTGTVYI